jgi:hypothetical protein
MKAVLVEPTAARTSWQANVTVPTAPPDSPYQQFRHDLAAWRARTYAQPPGNIAGRFAVSADDVAAAVTRAATARRPRARYPVGALAYGLFALRRSLAGPAFDAFVRAQFPVPRQDSAS